MILLWCLQGIIIAFLLAHQLSLLCGFGVRETYNLVILLWCLQGIIIAFLLAHQLSLLCGFGVRETYNLVILLWCLWGVIIAFLLPHQSQDSNTALHIAAKLGNTEALKALLRGGASPLLMNVVCFYLSKYMCV